MLTFILILVCYLIIVLGIPYIYSHSRGREARPTVHYLLRPRMTEQNLEWTIRALKLHALMKGYDLKITVIDRNLSPEMRDIVRKLAEEGIPISIQSPPIK